MKITIKPLSQNEAFLGRKRKSTKYREYESFLLNTLPDLAIPNGRLSVHYTFGFSNKASDIDNPIKSFQDVLQKRYSFDDKMIYRLIVDKIIVKKGEEFIEFVIESFN